MCCVQWLEVRGDALLKVTVFHEGRSCCADASKPSSSYGGTAPNDPVEGDVVAIVGVACGE